VNQKRRDRTPAAPFSFLHHRDRGDPSGGRKPLNRRPNFLKRLARGQAIRTFAAIDLAVL
jgi:hypothetical protein